MSFIHIKKQKVGSSDNPREVFVVPAMAITTGQGKKLIPNPAGTENCVFETFEEAEQAVKRAGFDYIFEGKKTYTLQQPPAPMPMPETGGPISIQEAIPLLIERLKDRESSVIAHAAFALGELIAEKAIEPLIGLLGHEDGSVRKEVAEALAKMGGAAVSHLKSAFQSARRSKEKNANYIRLSVINTYLEMTRSHRELLGLVMPQVVEGLSDESWLVRSQAALVIGHSAQYFRGEEEE